MLSTEQILENAARDGSIDISEWPRVLESVLQKLHDIVHYDFPIPSLPLPAPSPQAIDPEVVASTPPGPSNNASQDLDLTDADENDLPSNSQSSTKENDAPRNATPARPPVPKFDMSHTPQSAHPPPNSISTQSGTLPPDLLSTYQSSARILESDFADSPPYTIQRLAELVMHPRKHYRFLPSYLRALDRVVSVSSPVSDFPLPTGNTNTNGGGFLTNGDANLANTTQERDGLGSDESLGGALLTPIPWLRNNSLTGQPSASSQGDGELHSERTETILGPNGAGSIETVSVTVNGVPSATSVVHTSPSNSTPASPTLSEQSDASTSSSAGSTEAQLREQGGVTQGELLRQEQEAGVVPVAQSMSRRSLVSSGAVAVGRESGNTGPNVPVTPANDAMDDRTDEAPHARGPEEIGMEDMGPQHHPVGANTGLDMEAAVGRSKSPQPPQHTAAPQADAMQEEAEQSDAGRPGQDPGDVGKDMERLRSVMDEEKEMERKTGQGDEDVIIADADGRDTADKMDEQGDLNGADAVDTTLH